MAADINSFDPRLIEAWKRAATETITLNVANRSMALQLRQRLYRLRKAMGDNNHEVYKLAVRASIQIRPDDLRAPEWQVVLAPADAKLDASLSAAGLDIPTAPELPALNIKE